MAELHIERDVPSPPEGFARTVRVWLPDAYAREPTRRFPVLYMQDGQNVFAHPTSAVHDTWCVNRALEALVGEGRLAPWLVVAVDSGAGRLEEYSPWDEPRAGVRGRGEPYARFFTEHLVPWVDRTLRTEPRAEARAVVGSSLGGLISLYLPERELFLVLEPGGHHHERDWQRRLPLALRWLLA